MYTWLCFCGTHTVAKEDLVGALNQVLVRVYLDTVATEIATCGDNFLFHPHRRSRHLKRPM